MVVSKISFGKRGYLGVSLGRYGVKIFKTDEVLRTRWETKTGELENQKLQNKDVLTVIKMFF